MRMKRREIMIEKNSGLWHNIPLDKWNDKPWKEQKQHKDPLEFLERSKIPYCRYTNRPISDNRKEIHPEHIAKAGYCVYCGRLR